MASDVILENFEDLSALGEDKRQEILDSTKQEVFEKLKEILRPEFLNRIDEKIMFLPLTKPEIKQIALLSLNKVKKNLARREFGFEISDSALTLLADLGYDPQFGARPLQRVIQKELINELSKQVLSGAFTPGETIYIDTDKLGFTFSEKGFDGKGEKPEAPDAAVGTRKAKAKAEAKEESNGIEEKKRKKDLDKLMKATKDVEDATQELEEKD
jgi:ATP-dependent Clp protease ATP-binding subunit ClpB